MKKYILPIALLFCAAVFMTGCGSTNIKFDLNRVEGPKFNSEVDAKNKPIFLAFMATYCGYCKMSVPMVNEINAKYADKGLVVLGVFSDDMPGGPAVYLAENGVKYTSLYNGGQLSEECLVNGVPHFVLLNKNHNIVRVWTGYSPNHNFEEYIERVIK
ncbi:thiol-disulfide isomerase/thioredoxin [Elusimicrobium posterum]|uniref:TlpA family protein disulfide reductase n=1 Tax=Elusimicrobium posterum TaxID=3116653 RepID=UPI003C78DA19